MAHVDDSEDLPEVVEGGFLDSGPTTVASIEPGVPPSEAVVRVIAEITDVSATDLTPLYESIDPDALDGLFEHASRKDAELDRLAFTYAGHHVAVCGNGTIEISGASTESDPVDPDRTSTIGDTESATIGRK